MYSKHCVSLFVTTLLLACEPVAQADQGMQRVQDTKPQSTDEKDKKSLCTENEHVLMSCRIEEEGKIASICGSKDVSDLAGYVYYAFGTRDKREIIFSDDKSPPNGRFKRTRLSFAGATGGIAYSFVNEGWKYIFYSISGTGFDEQGVMVVPGDAPPGTEAKAVSLCEHDGFIEARHDAWRGHTESWNVDPAIDQYGLPPLSDDDSLARCIRQNSGDICRS